MDCSMSGLPVHYQLLEFTQTHVHWLSDAHLILYCPLLLLPSIFPGIRVFSNESALHIRWPKYWSFSFKISPEYGRTDAEAETPILWPPDANNWLIWKDPDAGRDWRCEEKGTWGMDGITDSLDMSLSEVPELVMDREAWPAAVHGISKCGTRLSNWSELNWTSHKFMKLLDPHLLDM